MTDGQLAARTLKVYVPPLFHTQLYLGDFKI